METELEGIFLEGYSNLLEVNDWLFPIMAIVCLFGILRLFQVKLTKGLPESCVKWYYLTFILRVVVCFISLFLFQNHFQSGDIFDYHEASKIFRNITLENPKLGFEMMSESSENWSPALRQHKILPRAYTYFDSTATGFLVRFGGILMLIFGGVFLAASIFFTGFGFLGSWLLFQYFGNKYPMCLEYFKYLILLFPSVVFWTSTGIIKEPLVFFLLSTFVVLLFKSDGNEVFKFSRIGTLCFVLLLLFFLKFYLFGTVLIGTAFYIYSRYIYGNSEFTTFTQFYLSVTLFICTGVILCLLYQINLSFHTEKVSGVLEDLERARTYNISLLQHHGGSNFVMDPWDGSFYSAIKTSLNSFLAALYRPFIWEAESLLVRLASLESLFLALLTIFLVSKKSVLRKICYLPRQSEVVFLLVFTVIVSVILGYTSLNFGTLSRYRSLMIPFYLIGIILLTKVPASEISK